MNVKVFSVYDAFEYVMAHYAPAGLEELAPRQDTYAVISLQDTHLGNLGLQFTPNHFCRDVLTLYVDDIIRPVEGAVLFDREHARQIIDFIDRNRSADTLMIHCYAGQSRSAAVGDFARSYLGLPAAARGGFNMHIRNVLTAEAIREERKE